MTAPQITNRDDLKEALRRCIITQLVDEPVRFGDCDSLYDLHILDSMRILQLMSHIYADLGIAVDTARATVSDFETLDSITSYVWSLFEKDRC